MLHLWTLIPALYVVFRFVMPLGLSLTLRLSIAFLVVIFAEYHLSSRLIFGNMFSPELPQPVMILQGWLFGAIVFFAILLVGRDLFSAAAFLLKRKARVSQPVNYLLLAAALLLSGVGIWQASRVPAVKEVEVRIKGLPEAFDGYRITQLTDLHVSRLLTASWLQKVVDKTNAQHADAIAVTGDMADGYVAARETDMAPLAQLRAADGVWAVTGNHEYYFDGKAWIAAYQRLGLRFLNNQHTLITRNGDVLVLAGITDEVAARYGGQAPDLPQALAGVKTGESVILLSHRPDNARRSAEAGVSLQLSGHTHGGMMDGLATVVARANGGFVSGLYTVGNMALYVSNGTGLWNGFPLRLGKPAEITVITLRAG